MTGPKFIPMPLGDRGQREAWLKQAEAIVAGLVGPERERWEAAIRLCRQSLDAHSYADQYPVKPRRGK